jgi:hypothetical protein
VRTDYLHKTASATIAANGTAVVTLRPDVGQYWALKFVRVSTSRSSTFNLVPYCAVYTGATAQTIPSTFIDDTYTGDGDTSGIVSGTVIEYGDGITAVFQFGTPGDVVVFDVYGQSADVPPSLGLAVPDVIGPHFFGKPVKPQPWQAPTKTQEFEFPNPGSGTSFVIINPVAPNQLLYLHTLEWQWDVALVNAQGQFISNNSLLGDSPTSNAPRYMDFQGFATAAFGQQFYWFQEGAAAANGTTCRGSITYSLGNATAT